MTSPAQISGEVESIRTFSASWSIAKIRMAGAGADVTVVGKLLSASPGDHVEARGAWSEHPKWGRQFKADDCTVTVPQSQSGIVAWIKSRLPQLGDARAKALVEKYGDGIWDVIEHRSDELRSVPGLTAERVEAIVTAYREHRGERDRIVRLKSWGLSDHQISVLSEAYGPAGVERELRENPYRLCTEVHGFGWIRTDAIARRMGMAADAPARIVAACRWLLDEAATSGHVYVARGALVRVAGEMLGVVPAMVMAQLPRLVAEGAGVIDRGGRYYLARLDKAEGEVAEWMKAAKKKG